MTKEIFIRFLKELISYQSVLCLSLAPKGYKHPRKFHYFTKEYILAEFPWASNTRELNYKKYKCIYKFFVA